MSERTHLALANRYSVMVKFALARSSSHMSNMETGPEADGGSPPPFAAVR
jgi:hypothetical protein